MDNKVYLSDIAGYENEKDEAKKIIRMLKNYEQYKNVGANIPKGLILSGRPGVGKTLLAKAIANESGVPFYEFESNECESETATIKSIKDLFAKAKENAPSIIFIDELDELVMTERYMSDYSRKTTKILLTEIDGISSSNGVLVIATSNNRDMLPSALLRSGRMDKKISFEVPDLKDREAIFKYYLSKSELLKEIDAYPLAIKTANFTGADIKTLVNETVVDCLSQDIKEIKLEDFERNIPVIIFKDIKKDSYKGPSDLTCYHEIGHFITEYKMTGNIGSISTFKYGSTKGHVRFVDLDEQDMFTKNKMNQQLITVLGGLAAEEVMCNDASGGSLGDVMKAKATINSLMSSGVYGFEYINPAFTPFADSKSIISQRKIERMEKLEETLLNEGLKKAKDIIIQNKDLVEYLFKEIKERKTLSNHEAEEVLERFNKLKSSNNN